jgi:hypothetical protein
LFELSINKSGDGDDIYKINAIKSEKIKCEFVNVSSGPFKQFRVERLRSHENATDPTLVNKT